MSAANPHVLHRATDPSTLLYRDVFINAPLGLYTLDAHGTITSFNPKMEELSGDRAKEAIGLNVFKMASYKKAGLDVLFKKGLGGKSFEIEVEYTSHVGKKTSIRHYRGIPLKGNDGTPGQARLLLIVEDVTDKRRIEEQLRNSVQVEMLERQRLVTLINSMADAVIAVDGTGNIIVYNGAALDLLNTNATILHQPLGKYLQAVTRDKTPVDVMELARTSGRVVRRDDLLLRITPDEFINLYLSIAPVHLGYSEEGEDGFVLVLRDITKEKSIEEQRDEFISVVSHELRTPIAIVEANVSTSMLPQVLETPEKARELLGQAHRNIVFLAALVNDITTLAHAERGQLEASLELVDVALVVEELAATFKQRVSDKKLTLKLDIRQPLPAIESNAQRLKEILQNLVTNAIKYTTKGSVTLGVRQIDDEHVQFTVTDTGIGMSKSDQKHVFSKFWRSEDYRTREHDGTGLGLYIAKKLAERMHGTIEFESKLHKGSTFSLTAPVKLKK